MSDTVIVYWRDIPAQVIVGKGRRAAKVQLPERFEQAIDRAAMKIGAKDGDAYMAEWKKVPGPASKGDPQAHAEAIALGLEGSHDQDRLKQLIDNEGRA